MEITFHGAARTVTGSQHLIRVNGKQILLDCGFYQGSRQESYQRNRSLPYDAAAVDVMILSHAHIDHSANIPNLVKSGFDGDIYCTYATRDLCSIMLRDSAKILESDVEYLNRKQDGAPLEPIYTTQDAVRSLNHFLGMSYDRTREVMPGVSLTFYDAGHILGSAIVTLDIEDREQGRDIRLVFSGDLGRQHRPILRDPRYVEEADVLLVESTYGDRLHEADYETDARLEQVITETVRRGGKVIVPAFAVGRTQELVYRLHEMVQRGEIPDDLPVFVDSPLAVDATGIYRLHPEAYDEELEAFMLQQGDPFGFDMLAYTRSVSQSKALNSLERPAVIISASGMAEYGRILHHLKNNIGDPRSTVMIVGWQAPSTLGRRLVENARRVRIFGEEYEVRAEVVTMNGMSAHADRDELLDWIDHFRRKPRHTFIVHGEETVSLDFSRSLRQRGLQNVHVPHLGQSFTV